MIFQIVALTRQIDSGVKLLLCNPTLRSFSQDRARPGLL
jgi:hypothetical protein